MKEINVMSLFGAIERAQGIANQTGTAQTVRLSDHAVPDWYPRRIRIADYDESDNLPEPELSADEIAFRCEDIALWLGMDPAESADYTADTIELLESDPAKLASDLDSLQWEFDLEQTVIEYIDDTIKMISALCGLN